MVPEAARSYTALLGDIRKTEQEISAPQYANQLIEYRNKKSEIKKQLECCQKEKEGLLEKSAKGRQILLNSQFTDQESVQKYMEDTRKLYGEYQNTLAACSKNPERSVLYSCSSLPWPSQEPPGCAWPRRRWSAPLFFFRFPLQPRRGYQAPLPWLPV